MKLLFMTLMGTTVLVACGFTVPALGAAIGFAVGGVLLERCLP